MVPSLWRTPDGRLAVSKSSNQPGPVSGYVVQNEDGTWSIQDDAQQRKFKTVSEAMEALVR